MSKRRNLPCAGGCGTLLWSGGSHAIHSLPTCRPCRRAGISRRPSRAPRTERRRCIACDVEFDAAWMSGLRRFRVTCSPVCARLGRVRTCADCGSECRSRMPHPRCKPCSRAHAQASNRRKCAQRRGASPIGPTMTIVELGDRDRWICHLCRRRVGRKFKAPHPRSATFDHLVPVSDGGDDSPANLRLAHWHCNSSRGAGGTVQLMLVG